MKKYLMLLMLVGCVADIPTDTTRSYDVGDEDVAVTEQALFPRNCDRNRVINTAAVRCSAYDNQDDGSPMYGFCPSNTVYASDAVLGSSFLLRSLGSTNFSVQSSAPHCVRTQSIHFSQECCNAINGSQASPVRWGVTAYDGAWWAPTEGKSFSGSNCGQGLVNCGLTIEVRLDGYTNRLNF